MKEEQTKKAAAHFSTRNKQSFYGYIIYIKRCVQRNPSNCIGSIYYYSMTANYLNTQNTLK